MNKKIIGAILCFCFMTMGVIPVIGSPSIPDIDPELTPYVQEILESSSKSYGDYFIITVGPVLKIFSNVELISGSQFQMKLIKRHLDRRLLRPSVIFKAVPIFVENLSFTVEYKKDVRNNSRFSYFSGNATVIYNETGAFENLTDYSYIVNKIHKITVENMTGLFIFFRVRLFELTAPLFRKIYQPARFCFIGFCDGITVSETE